jgi:outer membrane protein OmpA-like peptidoglycan-associated protein
MRLISKSPKTTLLIASLALAAPASISAQLNGDILVEGERQLSGAELLASLPEGPEVEGVISARNGNRIQVTATDGSNTVVEVNEATRIRATKGLLGLRRDKLDTSSLLNGLPVAIKTVQGGGALYASSIKLSRGDLETANMIRAGTSQGFAEQTAATEALRGRLGDIDQYNVKSVTNVYFDSGRTALSESGKAELCNTASAADQTNNALLLVVGYTDSTGSAEVNQRLSEKRASRVVNYLQQACGWKPYRMLTPTGLATADPAASNETAAGKAQNRRVAVNVLVSKSVDGL